MKINPPYPHPDMPGHEVYAQEGPTKFMRPINKREKPSMKEHELNYWSGRDHS